MKITKKQLRRIIISELQNVRARDDKAAGSDRDDLEGSERPELDETDEESEEEEELNESRKLNERQVRRIIRQERRRLLSEATHGVISGIGFQSFDSRQAGRGKTDFAKAYNGTYAKSHSPANVAFNRRGSSRPSMQQAINEAYYTLENALRSGDQYTIACAATDVRDLLGSKLK